MEAIRTALKLLEQGEAWVIVGALSSYALERKAAGAPIDLAAPKEDAKPAERVEPRVLNADSLRRWIDSVAAAKGR